MSQSSNSETTSSTQRKAKASFGPQYSPEIIKAILDHYATTSEDKEHVQSVVRFLSRKSPTYLRICRPYVFQEIHIGFTAEKKQASLDRLRNLANILNERGANLKNAVTSLVAEFSSPRMVPKDVWSIPNDDGSLIVFFNLPNVTTMTITHDIFAYLHSPHSRAAYSLHHLSTPKLPPDVTSLYNRNTLLGRYLQQLITLTIEHMEKVPLFHILAASPALSTLTLHGCSISSSLDQSEIDAIYPSSNGFNLKMFCSKGTKGNCIYTLSLCRKLEVLDFDVTSTYGCGYQCDAYVDYTVSLEKRTFTKSELAATDSVLFDELIEARFAGETEMVVDFFTTGRGRKVRFPKLKHLDIWVDTDKYILEEDDSVMQKPYKMFKRMRMPVLSFFYARGRSLELMRIPRCTRYIQDTLTYLRLDWEVSPTYDWAKTPGKHIEKLAAMHFPVLEDVISCVYMSFDIGKPKPFVSTLCSSMSKFVDSLRKTFVEHREHGFPALKALRLDFGLYADKPRTTERDTETDSEEERVTEPEESVLWDEESYVGGESDKSEGGDDRSGKEVEGFIDSEIIDEDEREVRDVLIVVNEEDPEDEGRVEDEECDELEDEENDEDKDSSDEDEESDEDEDSSDEGEERDEERDAEEATHENENSEDEDEEGDADKRSADGDEEIYSSSVNSDKDYDGYQSNVDMKAVEEKEEKKKKQEEEMKELARDYRKWLESHLKEQLMSELRSLHYNLRFDYMPTVFIGVLRRPYALLAEHSILMTPRQKNDSSSETSRKKREINKAIKPKQALIDDPLNQLYPNPNTTINPPSFLETPDNSASNTFARKSPVIPSTPLTMHWRPLSIDYREGLYRVITPAATLTSKSSRRLTTSMMHGVKRPELLVFKDALQGCHRTLKDFTLEYKHSYGLRNGCDPILAIDVPTLSTIHLPVPRKMHLHIGFRIGLYCFNIAKSKIQHAQVASTSTSQASPSTPVHTTAFYYAMMQQLRTLEMLKLDVRLIQAFVELGMEPPWGLVSSSDDILAHESSEESEDDGEDDHIIKHIKTYNLLTFAG
ncbi:hypothetical protein CVT24_012631 [Panaeolus cyanescens]|uniref:Uncharacterized protein n=1 Tax=Panaeolus cyanescens TaxID=181874 RepID=A0A409WD36_9AGAR|nr:hypothetical protein CVT24_012631 [Panaeolus cyanescens]